MKTMRSVLSVMVCALAVLAAGALEAADAAATSAAQSTKTNYRPLAEARAKIGEVIATPAKMTEVMKTLSPEDQKTFLADVNAAIAKLPGSVEDRTAKYLNVNKAALSGATSGNLANVLAVTFASVPPESLVVISERYANDLFNRDGNPSNKYDSEKFTKTAIEVLGKVAQATSGSDDSGVRNTLAILMFVRAAGDDVPDVVEKLAATIPDATTRELATKEWIPEALAKDGSSYESMLAYADAGKAPNLDIVLTLAGPQIMEAVFVDLTSGMNNAMGVQTTPVLDQAFGKFEEARLYVTEDTTVNLQNGGDAPRTTDPTKPWNPGYKRGDSDLPHEDIKPQPEPEPEPYPYSSL